MLLLFKYLGKCSISFLCDYLVPLYRLRVQMCTEANTEQTTLTPPRRMQMMSKI